MSEAHFLLNFAQGTHVGGISADGFALSLPPMGEYKSLLGAPAAVEQGASRRKG